MRIFVDAMGGDLAPQAPVEGTVEALRRNPELTVTLAGIVPEIEKYLAGADDVRRRITLLDAPEVITNGTTTSPSIPMQPHKPSCFTASSSCPACPRAASSYWVGSSPRVAVKTLILPFISA